MKHDIAYLAQFIDKKLTEIKDKNNGSLKTVSDAFVFAFGPFISMHSGFEHECDEIAQYSDAMRVIQFAAYLIRRITGGISYGDAKRAIRDFIVEVDEAFPEGTHKKAHGALITFASTYMSSLREEQGTNLESFITNSAPIVPYQGMMKKQPLEPGCETRIDCADAVEKVIVQAGQTRSGNNDTLMNILLNNIAGVMKWKDLTTVIEDPVTGANNLLELDHLIIDRYEIPYAVRGYYFLATINYYGLPIEIFDKYLKFFRSMGDFSKPQTYEAFESMVNEMAETVNPNIATESWEDPEMEKKANQLYEDAIGNQYGKVSDTVPKFDFNAFLNFIAKHRNMQFGEWPRRAFISCLHDRKVLNVNNLNNDITIYELSGDVMICPFVDVFDYQVKLIIQGADKSDLEIVPLTSLNSENSVL